MVIVHNSEPPLVGCRCLLHLDMRDAWDLGVGYRCESFVEACRQDGEGRHFWAVNLLAHQASFYADEVSRRATLADVFVAMEEVGQTDFEALLDYAVYMRNLPRET